MSTPHVATRPRGKPWLKILVLLGLLYAFLCAIQVMGASFKIMGGDQAKGLFSGLTSPFAGLSVGILATVLVQSSSMTTSLVVTAVGAGQLPLEVAVFTIMGCNIGTTVTNTLVSLGHMRQNAEFKRAFAGSTMHDFFNIMAVLIFMPLEMATGILRRLATTLAKSVYGEADGGKLDNPIKAITKPIANGLRDFFQDGLDLSPGWTGGLMLALALLTLFLALVWITRTMRSLMLEKMEASLNKVL
ncbi:MAG: hypothetical protein KDB53_09265, partial [Planctomycetes bacterium]|nr:hypothetical protein [Planctomycetota bacterium]